ncbi:MAG TPA: HPF/RaiA family ribosome-associated protein [Chitinophagales bacterium]|nr:HPF/RaiA family ribosome-associated protein [Chitinophagales bacterium]
MQIQINTDNNVSFGEKQMDYSISIITKELQRFAQHITRIEVHLTDENGSKDGPNDKRCVMEARPEGLKPIAVTEQSDTLEKAITGAIDKLKSSLDSTLGRLKEH